MTLVQLEQKVATLEAELVELQHELLRIRGVPVIPGFGPVATFNDDTNFEDVARLGRAYRDKVNRASLKELDQAGDKEEAKTAEDQCWSLTQMSSRYFNTHKERLPNG